MRVVIHQVISHKALPNPGDIFRLPVGRYTGWIASRGFFERYVFYCRIRLESPPMIVFISWSGDRGRAAADALAQWLPLVINAIKPWVSTSGIDKGARWSAEIAAKLQESRAGIICLTPNSLHADWILFEAGALAKTVENTYVCPFLIEMDPTAVSGPLAQFQATKAVKSDVLRLITTLNRALGEDALDERHIHEALEMSWPRLEEKLKTLPNDGADVPQRSEKDLLNEVLETVRSLSRSAGSAFSFEDRQTIFQARAWRAARSIWPGAGGSWSGPAIIGDSLQYGMSVTRGSGYKNLSFTIKLPMNATPDEAERVVLAQLNQARTEEQYHDGISSLAGQPPSS